MKSDQEFLTSMWLEIDAQEADAWQKLVVHKLDRQLFIREVFAYGIIVALLVAGSLVVIFAKDNSEIIYVVAILLFSVAFFIEKVFYSILQGGSR